MLRKLLRSSAIPSQAIQQQARLQQLREYLCLREATDKAASEKASADFKALAEKYKLDSSRLMELFKILQNNPKTLHRYFTAQEVAYEKERIVSYWRKTSFFDQEKTYDQAYELLQKKYGDILNYNMQQSMRRKALSEIEAVFLSGFKEFTPGDLLNFTTKKAKIFQNLKLLKADLEKETNAATSGTSVHNGSEIKNLNEKAYAVMEDIFKQLLINSTNFGKLIRYIDIHQPIESLPSVKIDTHVEQEIEEIMKANPLGDDREAILKELFPLLSEPANYTFQPWDNERKTIFESAYNLNGQGFLFVAVGAVLISALGYKLWLGDGGLLTMLGLAGLGAVSLRRGYISCARYSLPYLTKANIHRDGRHVDLIITQLGRQKRVDNVAISDFKLHKTADMEVEIMRVKDTLANFRSSGIATDSWLATYGDKQVYVPIRHTGSYSIIDNLFAGRPLPQKLLQ